MSEERIREFGEEGLAGEEQAMEEEELGADEELIAGNGEFIGENEEEELGADEEFIAGNGEREAEEFGENDEGHPVSSPNKRIKEMSIDRLSKLPESVLIHILLSLDTKEAVMTSVLSRRWRFLWLCLPCLTFQESSREAEKICRFVAWVNRALVVCNGKYLYNFEVEFSYDSFFASDVNLWVQFAVKNKVNGISLLLKSSSSCKDLYKLPQIMFSNSSLERLWIRGCVVAPGRTVEWHSLTRLYLEAMELPENVIEKILSGCPVLSNFLLRGCWGFSCLNVELQKLKVLGIGDSEDGNDEPLLEISAPQTRSLLITQYPKGRQWHITNIPCVVKANFDYNGSDWDARSDEVMSNTKNLLENLEHVKELEIGHHCIEVVSMMAVNGWQLPQSRRECLKVNAESNEHCISGILALLESSPDLRTLVVNVYKPDQESITSGQASRHDLDCCELLHLRTVHITFSPDPNLAGKPFMRLAEILLKRATTLEKMIIDVENTSDFCNVIQTLLGYPRSSKNAEIILG